MQKHLRIIDLTKPLDASFCPYSQGNYTDPPYDMIDWSTIAREGFRVSRLSMGTQTGTHIDAPAHFLEGGATLEALLPDQLMGEYFWVDLSKCQSLTALARRMADYRTEGIVFLQTGENHVSRLSRKMLDTMLHLPAALWVLAGEVDLEDAAPFAFYRRLAGAGKFLVEDLDLNAARQVPQKGEIFVAPLRLTGVSGSPCRVMVRG